MELQAADAAEEAELEQTLLKSLQSAEDEKAKRKWKRDELRDKWECVVCLLLSVHVHDSMYCTDL
jgi:hypothetical protein